MADPMTDITLEQRARELLAAECGAPSAVGLHVAVGTQQALRAIEAALRLSAGADWVLPCDVRVPPATTINKGCKLSTLIHAMELRAETGVTRFPEKAAAPRHETGEASP